MTKTKAPDGHDDGKPGCGWCGTDPLYVQYHDTEWGVPERDDRALFEKLVLDGFQAGLSWITILRKRDNFRRAFDGFQHEKIARSPPTTLDALMQAAGTARNTIGSASCRERVCIEREPQGEPGHNN